MFRAPKAQFEALLHSLWERARELGWSLERPTGLVGATGLEARHVSRHYVWRAGYRRFARRRWPKLTLVGDAQTHLIGAAVVSWGPSQDSPEFPAALRQSARHVQWDRIIADAAYDAEHNHRLCREELGIRSTVIPLNKRRGRRWPKEPYRRHETALLSSGLSSTLAGRELDLSSQTASGFGAACAHLADSEARMPIAGAYP